MRRRALISPIIIAAILCAPMARADAPESAEQNAAINREATYLSNCSDILSIPSSEYEKHFVDSARTEAQMFQLLFDGGLIFSKLYVESFIHALDGTIDNFKAHRKTAKELGGYKPYKSLALNLAKIARLPAPQLNEFIWRVLESEKTLAAADGQESPDLKSRIRYEQVSKLVEALKTSANSSLVEKVFRDLVTQTLFLTARETMIQSLNNFHTTFSTGVDGVFQLGIATAIFTFIGMFAGDITGTLAEAFLQNHIYGPMVFGGILVGFITPLAAYAHQKLTSHSLIKNISQGPNASDADDADSTAIERFQISNVLTKFEELNLSSDGVMINPNNQLSIAQACDTNTCRLNPIQLAYVGDLDLIELQGLLRSLRRSLTANNASTDDLRHALKAVETDPNYENTMSLRVKIKDLGQFSGYTAHAEAQLLDKISQKIVRLRGNFARLRAKPFDEDRRTAEDRARGLLLLNRVNADLAKLDEFKWDVEKYAKSLDRLETYANLSAQWLRLLPRDEHGWREATRTILQQLDQLEAKP